MSGLHAHLDALLAYALRYPEARLDHPWGRPAVKVGTRIFFAGRVDEEDGRPHLTLSLKLSETGEDALMFPFTAPTGYGLGKSGWVTSTFEAADAVPIPLIEEWIDESYRAIAPRGLVRSLPDEGPPR